MDIYIIELRDEIDDCDNTTVAHVSSTLEKAEEWMKAQDPNDWYCGDPDWYWGVGVETVDDESLGIGEYLVYDQSGERIYPDD